MMERPILFSGPMVRAILDGRKTQTRRVVKPQFNDGYVARYDAEMGVAKCRVGIVADHSPYAVGDRLWVRETWTRADNDDARAILYRATAPWDQMNGPRESWKWKPSIHMPRWAARITLEVTGVRVERVQDTSEADAIAEGVEGPFDDLFTPRLRFERLWDAINAKRGYEWEANPWVWVVEFTRWDGTKPSSDTIQHGTDADNEEAR